MKLWHFWHVCTCSHKGVFQIQKQKVDFRESRSLIIFAICHSKINLINKTQQIFSVLNGMSNLNIAKIDKIKILHCNYTLILDSQNQMKKIITKFFMITLLIPVLNYEKSHISFKALKIGKFSSPKYGTATRIIQLHLQVFTSLLIFSRLKKKDIPDIPHDYYGNEWHEQLFTGNAARVGFIIELLPFHTGRTHVDKRLSNPSPTKDPAAANRLFMDVFFHLMQKNPSTSAFPVSLRHQEMSACTSGTQ